MKLIKTNRWVTFRDYFEGNVFSSFCVSFPTFSQIFLKTIFGKTVKNFRETWKDTGKTRELNKMGKRFPHNNPWSHSTLAGHSMETFQLNYLMMWNERNKNLPITLSNGSRLLNHLTGLINNGNLYGYVKRVFFSVRQFIVQNIIEFGMKGYLWNIVIDE